MVRIASVAPVVLAACGAAVPAVPGRGGPAWVELTSEHFTLWTDASSARGRELVREMEHFRQVVTGMAFPDLPNAGRSFVIALRDSDEVSAFVPDGFAAFALSAADNPIRQAMIVLPADDDGHIVVHELTHLISFAVIHRQPRWFAEGLARFFETVRLDPKRDVVDVGEPLDGMIQSLRYQRLVSPDGLFACQQLLCVTANFYTTAWATVSYLMNEAAPAFAQYEHLLDTVGPDRAWSMAFPNMTAEQLGQEVRQWLIHGKHSVWHFKVKLQEWPVTERPLGDGDVYAVRALLRAIFSPKQPATDLAAALAADPTNVLAQILALARGAKPSIADAHAAAAAHPDDWRAWALVASAGGVDAVVARDKACALAAQNPAVQPPHGLCEK